MNKKQGGRNKNFSIWGRSRAGTRQSRVSLKSAKDSGLSTLRTESNLSEEVSVMYVENLFDQLIPHLIEKHRYLPEKQLHYPIVRDHVATGIQATASLIKYWENATKNHHNFSAAYMKSVIPHISHTEIYQMRKFNSIIRHLNQARMEATVTYCKNVLMQVVKPAKVLLRHISQSVAANDRDMAVLIESYEMKEKNVKHGIRDLRAAEKNLDSCLIAWNEHKKHISKHFNVNVGSAANEIYRGFLKKKGSGTGGGMFGGIGGRRNWKERLFVLSAPESGKTYATLNYYTKDSSTVAKGSVIIDKSTIVNFVDDPKYSNAFSVMTEAFHHDGSHTHDDSDDDDNNNNNNPHGGESNLKQFSNYLHRKQKTKKTSLMLQAATPEDLDMWVKYIERTVTLFSGKSCDRLKSKGKGFFAPVSPRKLREVQDDATKDTSPNRNLARDARGIELEELANKAKNHLAMQQQQLKYTTSSLEKHHEEHKQGVSRVIRKLLRVELYRGEEQRKLMKTFIILESIFDEKTRPFIQAALESVHTVDAVEDVKFFVNNIVGSNGIDDSISKPIGTLAPLHILSGNRPVISTDLMQELIDSKTISADILKGVKDITKQNQRGSIFDESALFSGLDSVTDEEFYVPTDDDDRDSKISKLTDDLDGANTSTLTSEALDEFNKEMILSQQSVNKTKRSSSWGGRTGPNNLKTKPRTTAMSDELYIKKRQKDPGVATIKFEGGFSPCIDSWDAMMDQLDIEKNDLRTTMSKMMGGGKAARNSLGSSDIDGNNGNKYGNGTKIGRHSLEGSNKKVVKSRRKSSLTPFAQRLLGTK